MCLNLKRGSCRSIERALDVATNTVDLTNLVFPYPSEHYVLDGTKLTEELGTEIRTGNRQMLEEYSTWEAVADHSPRRYGPRG